MQTVYVGLSGGVDSSVAALLLKQQGYRVVGVFMKNWTKAIAGAQCPWREDLADAQRVAVELDIPFKVFDFEREYKQLVVDYMLKEFSSGRTPNPDIICNQEIKFKLFLDASLQEGADLIATGHYAKVKDSRLYMAQDEIKDQTYFLYRVTAQALAKTLMPIGDYIKQDIRALAKEFNLPTAAKKDSVGICFVGQVGIRDFLREYIPDVAPGQVILKKSGEALGVHEGAIFYTIGQRHGLGIGGGKPLYVVGKDMEKNEVYVSDDPGDMSLYADIITITQTHWINDTPSEEGEYQVRIRHTGKLTPCKISRTAEGYLLTLERPERAITPGQSAVIYEGKLVMGGGVISA